MRVAHVVSQYGVVSEGFVVDAIQELDSMGWEAWVLTLSVARDGYSPFPPGERVICVPEGSRARREVGRLFGSNARRFANHAAQRIGPVRPSLIHAHFGWSGRLAAPLARRLELPLVVTFHATDVTVYPRLPRSLRILTGVKHKYETLFMQLDRAIVVSRFIESELRALGFEGQIDIVPAGVRLSRLPFRREVPANGATRLLYVGRLVPRKGLDVLLRALAIVAAGRPDVELEVVGDGPSRPEFEALAGRVGAGRRVVFHGARPPGQVAEALRRAHILVVPSRTMPDGEAEGSPVVTKEALAVGVPIVATRSGGLPETIPPPYRHELVAEDDPPALAERILELLEDDASWRERARVGRAWVEQQFDWGVLGRRTNEIYGEVCGDPSLATIRRASTP